MAFQSLYRRYRPQRFGDLVGQDHVATALRNAVREDRVGHAYLFSGPRGTGKTTTARILAKAVNCTSPGDDGEPCGECDNCRAVAAGTFGDLVELDAASNNGVEAVRDLIDRVHLGMGASTRRKVYLVDEVHMLSNAASNALLKTLEEPPGHVVFVLATTNPEKVLPTIRSRTQHFEFSLIPTEQLAAHLAGVLGSEGVEADPEAIDALARVAAGSARDALSLLDQALAHEPDHLRAEAVTAIFGRTPFETRAAILEAVSAEDPVGALGSLHDLLESGHEPRRVAADLLQALRDAFVLHVAAGRVRVDLSDAERERLTAIGAGMGEGALVRAVDALGRAVVDMRGVDAADPRLVLEVALLRIAHRRAGPPLQVLTDRIERVERALADGRPPAPAPRAEASEPARPTGPKGDAEPSRRRASSRRAEASAGSTTAAETSEERGGQAAAETGGETGGESAAETGGESGGTPPATRPRAALGALLRERRGGAAGAEPAPGPAVPVADGPAPGDADLIDEVVLAWADVLAGLGPGSRSVLQEAQPLRVEGDVVVFGAPPVAVARVRPRFQQEAATIRTALSGRIGITPRFSVVAHDGFSSDIDLREPPAGAEPGPAPDHGAEVPAAPVPPTGGQASTPSRGGGASDAPSAGTATGSPPDPADDYVDPSELVDAPPAGSAADPTARLVEFFDATVVDEIPRPTSREQET